MDIRLPYRLVTIFFDSQKRAVQAVKKYFVILLPIVAVISIAAQAQDWSLIVRLERAVDGIVPADAKVEKLAGDFGFLEGPVWVRKGGYLLFSDIPANVIYKFNPDDGKVSVFLSYSGFTGTDDSIAGMQTNNGRAMVTLLGSNAVTLDPQGRVVYCAHGDRQIVRLEEDGRRTVLASQYEGKRINSPNDLVYKSDGSLYFTDPPSGHRNQSNDDPTRELPFNGIYLLKGGKLQLLDKTFTRPNGLAFAPGEKILYVNDTARKIIMRYDVQADDTVTNGQVFIDMNSDKAPEAPDGMKVDEKGNVYCTGQGGFWIMSPEGKHLGTVLMSEGPANLAFGGADGKTLFLAARTGLYRIQLKIPGIRP
jgi:gluconolactonase